MLCSVVVTEFKGVMLLYGKLGYFLGVLTVDAKWGYGCKMQVCTHVCEVPSESRIFKTESRVTMKVILQWLDITNSKCNFLYLRVNHCVPDDV